MSFGTFVMFLQGGYEITQTGSGTSQKKGGKGKKAKEDESDDGSDSDDEDYPFDDEETKCPAEQCFERPAFDTHRALVVHYDYYHTDKPALM